MDSTEPKHSSSERSEHVHRHYRHHGNPLGALILIGIGVIFLLQNFGLLNSDIWRTLWHFWPLILILFGLQLILGRSRLASFLVFMIGLVILAGLIIATALGIGGFNIGNVSLDQHISESSVASSAYPGASSRKVTVDNGLGAVELMDSSSEQLLDLDSRYSGSEAPTITTTESNGAVSIDIQTHDSVNGFFWMKDQSPRYQLQLGRPEVITSLSINNGVGTTDLNLTKLALQKINLENGTGTIKVNLGTTSLPREESTIKVGTGAIRVSLPAGIALQVRHSIGLGSVRIGDEELHGDGTYTSPGFDTAATKIRLVADVGTGSITISR